MQYYQGDTTHGIVSILRIIRFTMTSTITQNINIYIIFIYKPQQTQQQIDPDDLIST